MKGPQFVKGLVAVAVVLLTLTGAVGASAASPSMSVTCAVGAKTSFAHPPRGTNNVLFVYGALDAIVQWVGGRRSFATPTDVRGGTVVVATFYKGATQLGAVRTTCS